MAFNMRAQASPEFLIIYAAMMLVFIGVFAIYAGGSINLFHTQDAVATMRDAYAAAAVLNYVYVAGDGAAYNFTLSGVSNAENVSVSQFEVTASRPQATAVAPLITGSVNATSLGRGDVNVANRRGSVYVG